MKMTFLGTSAGESYPAIWCDCPNCTYARKHGGKNLRMNTGSLLDDDVLLDLNSCTFYTAARLGISLTGITSLLATHPHSDHMTLEPLAWRLTKQEYEGMDVQLAREQGRIAARFTPLPLLTLYGNAHVESELVSRRPDLFDGTLNTRLRFQRIEFGKRYEANGGLSFIPVEAMHGPEGFANSYIIERGGKRMLYALDTGGYKPEMQQLLDSYSYDLVVMEGTFGLSNISVFCGHQHLKSNREFRDHLLEKGCIQADTPFVLTHLCPHWTPPYDLYAPIAEKEGFIVAYDGMSIEV